ncbi:MAG: hypothetical protein Q8K99_13105 [Actinomycetota bacterium]|nr:hypothetical protein [Actinomycetota bacterium]
MCQGSVNNDQMVQAIGQARETVKLAERAGGQLLKTASRASDGAVVPPLGRAARLLTEASEELHQALHAASEPEPSGSTVVERV